MFRLCVKLINAKVLKVLSRSDTFFACYSRKKHWGLFDPPTSARVDCLAIEHPQIQSWAVLKMGFG